MTSNNRDSDSHSDKEALLARAAGQAAGDAFFLGSALAVYQEEHGLSEHDLAAYLGCARDWLSRLALCRRPNAQSSAFRREVEQIAAYAGARPLQLGALLRDVEAGAALRGNAAGVTLLAARDKDGQSDA